MISLGAKQESIRYHISEQNGHAESFHKTLKKEYIWPHEFESYQNAEVILAKVYQDHNHSKIYTVLGYVAPEEFISE